MPTAPEPHGSGVAGAELDDAAAEHAKVVLAAAREELTRADGKASVLLASAGVVIGALTAALLAGTWDPSDLWNGIEWVWWVGVASAAVAVGALGYAVYPRTTYRGTIPGTIAYFGDVVATPRRRLEARLQSTGANGHVALLDQLVAVSVIVDRKYRALQLALWCLAVAGLACVSAVLVSRIAS